MQHTAAHCSTLQHTAAHCNTLQHTTRHYKTLQHTATHCNTLQHTATHPLQDPTNNRAMLPSVQLFRKSADKSPIFVGVSRKKDKRSNYAAQHPKKSILGMYSITLREHVPWKTHLADMEYILKKILLKMHNFCTHSLSVAHACLLEDTPRGHEYIYDKKIQEKTYIYIYCTHSNRC